MKKYNVIKIILSAFFAIALISCKSKEGNKIKSIKLNTYFIDHESSEVKEGALFTSETFEYDTNFNLIKDRFDSYKYDFDKNRKISKKYSYNNSGGLFQMEVYKNDSAGNVIVILDYDYTMKEIEHKTLLEYNLTGNLIKQSIYDNNDSLKEKHKYEYDNKKVNVKKETTSKYDELFFKYSYQYDNKNRMIEKTIYGSGGDVIRKVIYEYDFGGNKKRETTYTLNDAEELSVNSRKLFKYDTANNLVKETSVSNEKEYQTTYEYNKDGKLSKEISSESEILYSYVNNDKITKTCIGGNKNLWWKEEDHYDDNGNRTQSIHYNDLNKISNRYFYGYNEKNQLVFDSCVDINDTLSFMNKFFYKNDTLRYKKSVSLLGLSTPDSDYGYKTFVEIGDGRYEYTTYQILDKMGNVIDELIEYTLVQQLEFDYKQFDPKGNWTKRLIKKFGEPERIETREMEYY